MPTTWSRVENLKTPWLSNTVSDSVKSMLCTTVRNRLRSSRNWWCLSLRHALISFRMWGVTWSKKNGKNWIFRSNKNTNNKFHKKSQTDLSKIKDRRPQLSRICLTRATWGHMRTHRSFKIKTLSSQLHSLKHKNAIVTWCSKVS